MALHTDFHRPLSGQSSRIDDRRPQFLRHDPRGGRQVDVPLSRPMAALAIDALRYRLKKHPLRAHLLVSLWNLRIGVVTEHAFVGHSARRSRMIRTIVAR